VWGWGLTRGKKTALITWEEARPLFNRRGDRTRNLLGGGLFACFLFVLSARAGARGCLSIGGGGVIVGVEVAEGKGGQVICASPVFPGFVAVGVSPSVLFGVTESLAKLGIVEWYEVFRILICVGCWCGRCSGPFLLLP